MATGGVCKCIVCEEEYHSRGDKAPKVLRCGHSFCAMCVDSLIRHHPHERRAAVCPVCRKETPEADVSDNYGLQDAVAMQWATKATLAADQAAEQIKNLEGRVGELRRGAASLQSIYKPLVGVPVGSSLGAFEYYSLVDMMGGDDTQLRLLYRASVDGPTYDDQKAALGVHHPEGPLQVRRARQ